MPVAKHPSCAVKRPVYVTAHRVHAKPEPRGPSIREADQPEASIEELKKICWHYLDLVPEPDPMSKAAQYLYDACTSVLRMADTIRGTWLAEHKEQQKRMAHMKLCMVQWSECFSDTETPASVKS
eukprot:Sspe_Gene.32986::Locus_16143_Transcript_2_2_Confidence_0.667_Length_438::g.32986::m.32986